MSAAAICWNRHHSATHNMSKSYGSCTGACVSFADGIRSPCTDGISVKRTTSTGLVTAATMHCTIWCSSAQTTTVPYTEPTRPSTGLMRVSYFQGIGSPCESPATLSRHNEVSEKVEVQHRKVGALPTCLPHLPMTRFLILMTVSLRGGRRSGTWGAYAAMRMPATVTMLYRIRDVALWDTRRQSLSRVVCRLANAQLTRSVYAWKNLRPNLWCGAIAIAGGRYWRCVTLRLSGTAARRRSRPLWTKDLRTRRRSSFPRGHRGRYGAALPAGCSSEPRRTAIDPALAGR